MFPMNYGALDKKTDIEAEALPNRFRHQNTAASMIEGVELGKARPFTVPHEMALQVQRLMVNLRMAGVKMYPNDAVRVRWNSKTSTLYFSRQVRTKAVKSGTTSA